ncbi:hypothetical protein DFJ73DRAFT_956193 [Zopfochytrium polystomum]|nr:hypothetical protein DFJ73DRAFT_956193 [Zopfochytrium polystomum]
MSPSRQSRQVLLLVGLLDGCRCDSLVLHRVPHHLPNRAHHVPKVEPRVDRPKHHSRRADVHSEPPIFPIQSHPLTKRLNPPRPLADKPLCDHHPAALLALPRRHVLRLVRRLGLLCPRPVQDHHHPSRGQQHSRLAAARREDRAEDHVLHLRGRDGVCVARPVLLQCRHM